MHVPTFRLQLNVCGLIFTSSSEVLTLEVRPEAPCRSCEKRRFLSLNTHSLPIFRHHAGQILHHRIWARLPLFRAWRRSFRPPLQSSFRQCRAGTSRHKFLGVAVQLLRHMGSGITLSLNFFGLHREMLGR